MSSHAYLLLFYKMGSGSAFPADSTVPTLFEGRIRPLSVPSLNQSFCVIEPAIVVVGNQSGTSAKTSVQMIIKSTTAINSYIARSAASRTGRSTPES
ncbi:hypothetical protein EDB87DRAFT_574907 [Lactarius vividus]|nr:hypothetical protein EDB87DRAFT_574907 [Lactarius vividus]